MLRTVFVRLSDTLSMWRPATVRKNWPGIAIAIVIALAASFISDTYGGPQLLYALFFGLSFHFLSQEASCKPGIDFCSKTVLRIGVALLGARVTFGQIESMGIRPILIVIAAVLITILFGYVLAFKLRRPATEGVLSGGAVAICGASAALAIAAVLPQTKENEKFTLLTVVGVTTLSTIAMVVYPVVARLLDLDPTMAGIFIGGTIHDVAQVVGAGYLMSNHTGDVATLVKLTRVACLVPVVIGLTIIFSTRNSTTEFDTPPLVPFFLIGFVWLMACNSAGFIPPEVAAGINRVSRACLVTAIAALGVKTSFQSLASLGWRPIAMLVAETVWLAVFVLLALAAL
ncbi:YeiH family protein [Herbaspirillum sp. GCM10030257]|uniref:YeiH family protein n=1 Tax=Herbaspirillum sp. GCM10030257 TaxID=3273393 RepID=UPI00360F0E07